MLAAMALVVMSIPGCCPLAQAITFPSMLSNLKVTNTTHKDLILRCKQVVNTRQHTARRCRHQLNRSVITYTETLIPPVFACSNTLERAFGFNIFTTGILLFSFDGPRGRVRHLESWANYERRRDLREDRR